jgi:beta-galactosidase
MRGENKGLAGPVTIAGEPIESWLIYSLPMSPASIAATPGMPVEAHFTRHSDATAAMRGPAFYRGTFRVRKVHGRLPDTFLDVRDLGKGAVWINGHSIGRYWNIGPQATLYVPGPWLRDGKNEIVVLYLFARAHLPRLAGLSAPILSAPVK